MTGANKQKYIKKGRPGWLDTLQNINNEKYYIRPGRPY
jgi:hypothetical protein